MPMPFFFFDPTMILILPALLLAGWAQLKVKSTYAKYSRVMNRQGIRGAEVAKLILRDAGLDGAGFGGEAIELECIPGNLTDHYDPTSKTLRLSEAVYHGQSVAALGIAAHEVGHAIQHARSYAPLALRGVMYPLCSLGSTLAWPIFILGFFFHSGVGQTMMTVGILLFSAAVAFSVVTLPVELDASRRAMKVLAEGGYLVDDELKGARKVLTAAAMTYVAAAAMAIMQLVRMFILADRD